MHDVAFYLRPAHQEQVASILSDPEASDNDKFVALTFLRNAEVSALGQLPFCQDTGTAIILGKKGQNVWTGACDEEYLSHGSTTPTRATTSAIRKMRPSTCTVRSIRGATSPRRSI